jgi:peptidoglycan/xylan/chitin deacetylase (PgdA/CDA1 family)
MTVALLVYHRITAEAGDRFHDVVRDRFAAQLDQLAARGARVAGPGRLRLDSGRAVMLTFDDATSDHAEVGAMLAGRGWPGLFLVPAGRLGEPGRLRPADVARLATQGHVIGAHGFSHARFDRLDAGALEAELARPRARLQDLTGNRIDWLAPPGGICPPGIAELAAGHGYAHVRGLRWGYAPEPLGLMLPALPVNARTSETGFARLIDGRAPLWLGRLKDGARRLIGEALWDRLRERAR